MRFDEHFVRGALSELFSVSGVFPQDPQFSVDTRNLNKGDIFFALPGVQCDGHDFLAQAIQKGAGGLCVEVEKKHLLDTLDKSVLEKILVMIVPDTYYAFIRFATVWRAQFDYPVVAITGSVGKTSTKELLSRVLDMHSVSHMASYGNQNTKIGIALNMLRMRATHKVAIFEVGINKRGEMAKLAQMLRPTTAVITNIGHSHMEGLGSIGDIALEKRDIFKYFTAESIGVINGDQLLLSHVGYVHPVLKFGSKTTNQIQARKISISSTKTSFILKIYKDKYLVEVPNVHAGVIFNALAVTATAHLLQVPNEVIIKAIGEPSVVSGRFEMRPLKSRKGTVIYEGSIVGVPKNRYRCQKDRSFG
jgi:UDP-N-acetylmuramoyl-tripeptide--D-alanyl-D-alanine ligase